MSLIDESWQTAVLIKETYKFRNAFITISSLGITCAFSLLNLAIFCNEKRVLLFNKSFPLFLIDVARLEWIDYGGFFPFLRLWALDFKFSSKLVFEFSTSKSEFLEIHFGLNHYMKRSCIHQKHTDLALLDFFYESVVYPRPLLF